ncbi:MAG: hypothetical protein IT428_22150 [Planctomycetaceae bacterium]|nr:hypothetical protein [Planctomycetaceae bacterium]
MWPPHFQQFAAAHRLVGAMIEIPEADDASGLGASFQILDDAGVAGELDAYPGTVVAADGFVPIGGCLLGSGDPYFIRSSDPAPGPVYRIYHDSVFDADYDRDEAVATVLESYEDLLRFIEPARG